jgi:hypothetical protein
MNLMPFTHWLYVGRHNFMTFCDQLLNEPPTNEASRTGYRNLHHKTTFGLFLGDRPTYEKEF